MKSHTIISNLFTNRYQKNDNRMKSDFHLEYHGDVDDELNQFLEEHDHEIIKVTSNTIITSEHNNGGKNSAVIVHTVLYEDS